MSVHRLSGNRQTAPPLKRLTPRPLWPPPHVSSGHSAHSDDSIEKGGWPSNQSASSNIKDSVFKVAYRTLRGSTQEAERTLLIRSKVVYQEGSSGCSPILLRESEMRVTYVASIAFAREGEGEEGLY